MSSASGAVRESVHVCYVPAVDLRRLEPATTPYLSRLFASCPWSSIRTLPNVDHVPTMLTGVYPHQHGLWGLRIRDEDTRTPRDTILDLLPDTLNTAVQGMMHLADPRYDLATIPSHRRRRFESRRFKREKVTGDRAMLEPIGGFDTIFTAVGRSRGSFSFHSNLRGLASLLTWCGSGRVALEVVEIHSLDVLQHWELDRPERIAGYYKALDEYVGALHEKCRRNGVTLVLLSDHGMEPVTEWIDVMDGIRRLGVNPTEYSYFVENTKTTVWFHSDRARSAITDWLAGHPRGVLLGFRDLGRFDLDFTDGSYGDVFLVPEPGCTFFPNDFYHPVANVLLALSTWQQWSRLRSARHRGDHGYLPEAECERGFILLAEEGPPATTNEATLIDVAPSILQLLGVPAPATMRGKSVFGAADA
ncbi:MAG: alkaline phosphatase family protein [Gemmatimonadaceae bacterium]